MAQSVTFGELSNIRLAGVGLLARMHGGVRARKANTTSELTDKDCRPRQANIDGITTFGLFYRLFG